MRKRAFTLFVLINAYTNSLDDFHHWCCFQQSDFKHILSTNNNNINSKKRLTTTSHRDVTSVRRIYIIFFHITEKHEIQKCKILLQLIALQFIK